MVSFRDQENDGAFNLYLSTGDLFGEQGREYIYINAVDYDANTPSSLIATDGGHWHKALYMIWPDLAEGATWDPDNLPESKIVMDYGTLMVQSGEKTSIADSYGNHGGGNGYDQGAGFGNTKIPGLHPDHHNMVLIPTGDDTFTFIDANDGGLGISFDNGVNFNMMPNNYITTQFYGVAKHPEKNEYIGGMQDNGTWQSQADEDASDASMYLFRIGGDGFECLWHAENPDLLLGSVYNNSIRKSVNGGSSWAPSSEGIDDEDGPFVTHLSASKEKPNMVFAVGSAGIYRSADFGDTWKKRIVSPNWMRNDYLSSSTNVEVSLANGNIVWAGAGMSTEYGLNIHVSTNEGLSFSSVNDFDEVAMNVYISGIATHPTEENTAYVLFASAGSPKIVRTEDLGETWEDISGFGTNSSSSNGYPDVITSSLLVMPHDPNIIWAGTDIGLVESTDNGVSWHLADYDLPPVSVFDMHIVGNQVVLATHGRGIWSVNIPEIDNAPYINSFVADGTYDLSLSTNLKVAYDKVEIYIDGELNQTLDEPAVGINDVTITMTNEATYNAYIIGYIGDNSYKSNTIDAVLTIVGVQDNLSDDLLAYPNPSNGKFRVKLNSDNANIQIYSMSGVQVYNKTFGYATEAKIDISTFGAGAYFVKVGSENGTNIQKILVQE